jgi:ubiquinone biosynthesis monooxygenase Coq7
MNTFESNRAPLSSLDAWLVAADNALRTLAGAGPAAVPSPAAPMAIPDLPDAERRLSGALMRVNHVGEVCAQALYNAQALTARDAVARARFEAAGREETDHLAWTRDRLAQLGDRPSLLNPLWYLGSFSIGWVAGRTSTRLSLGFVVETERQVEAHLASHLERLPEDDHASRAIVLQMKQDEARHADQAEQAGGVPLPKVARWLMRAASKVMTTTAHRI